MNIEIIENEQTENLKVTITCKKLTFEVEKILAALRMINRQITGFHDGETYIIEISDVLYIESVDKKCFIYTEKQIYETHFKLYELENQLKDFRFLRISKSCIINLYNIQSLKSDINRKIRITMINGEQVIASRQYADSLKNTLGVK